MERNKGTEKRPFFRRASGIACLAGLLLLVMLAGVRFGSASMTWREFFSALFLREGFETQSLILYSVRLARATAGLLAGVGLSVSGVLLQSITDNGLASPNIIGVNTGAGFFVILTLSVFPAAAALLPIAAFAGAFLATLVILALAGGFGGAKSAVILAGIALTTLLSAGISFFTLLDADVLSSYNAFSVGGLAGVKYDALIFPAIIIAMSLALSLLFSHRIHLLCLGDASASELGVNVKELRLLCVVCASASAAAVVSFAGLLGFVGLVVPHIARRLVGNHTGYLLTASAFIGAILVILADLAGRVLAAPSEIPVGIMMAFIGAPFFMVLLLRRRMVV